MARINIFETVPVVYELVTNAGNTFPQNGMVLQGVYIPGTISFNNLAVLMSHGGAGGTVTLNFGLYSLNASTLSLANSASQTVNFAGNAFRYITLATSATQDITPGNWYLGLISSSGAGASYTILKAAFTGLTYTTNNGIAMAGQFVRGSYTVTTATPPTAICTTDCARENDPSFVNYLVGVYPYILIAA